MKERKKTMKVGGREGRNEGRKGKKKGKWEGRKVRGRREIERRKEQIE